MNTQKLKIFKSSKEYLDFFNTLSHEQKKSLAFVPTMGALHAGHMKLVQTAKSQNQLVVVSIFVNPTQFNNAEDLAKYPNTLDADIKLLEENQADILLLPTYNDLYKDNYRFKMTENEFSKILCGAHRPGHFDGVLSVVLKLLNIVSPSRAYFGLKDYQQYQLIHDMADAFFVKSEIIGVETVRESSGLAMSSRNMRLSEEGRKKASLIYQTISEKGSAAQAAKKLTEYGFAVDYCEDHFNRRFVAATLEGIRLIDNVAI